MAFCIRSDAWCAPGDHVRAGPFVLEPTATTGLEYHSNVYLADGVAQPTYGGLSLNLKPTLGVGLENDRLSLKLASGWSLRKMIDLDAEDDVNLSNADRYTDFDGTLGVGAFPDAVVGLRLDDRFQILNTAGELPTAGESANITQVSNDATGGFLLRPGTALELGLLGNFGLDRYALPEFVANSATNSNVNNRASYGPLVNLAWRFLPKTSIVVSGSANWTDWDNNLVTSAGPEASEGFGYGSYLGKPDAMSWRSFLGLKGQFTQKLAADASVGFGQMHYDEQSVLDAATTLGVDSSEVAFTGDESFARDLTSMPEALLLNLRVGYAPERDQLVSFGVQKDFQDSFFTNYAAYSYFFVKYEGVWYGRLGLTGEASYRIDAFHGEIERDDQNLALKLGSSWKFNRLVSAGLAAGWNQRGCLDPDCENGVFYATQYDDFWGQAGVTVAY